jgi:hypothetical protein
LIKEVRAGRITKVLAKLYIHEIKIFLQQNYRKSMKLNDKK